MKTFPFRILLAALVLIAAGVLAATVVSAGTQTGPYFVVNSLADTDDGQCDGLGQGTGNKDCTLREAINAADAYGDGAVVTFSVSGTIVLTSGLPQIRVAMTIDGTGQSVTISGNDSVSVFPSVYAFFYYHGSVNFNALTIAHGRGGKVGGVYIYYTNVNFTNCTFNDNYDNGPGGALNIQAGSSVVVANCTFYHNTAAYGSAVEINGNPNGAPSAVYIYSSTFAGNTATRAGYYQNATDVDSNNATAEIRNTILLTDTSTVYNVNCQGITFSDSSSICNVGYCGGAVQASAAQVKLDTLQYNGGPTATMALLPGSIAINTGNNSYATGGPVNNQDQRGYDRIRPGDSTCDVGAYEYGAGGSLLVTTANDLSSANANRLNSLRTAIAYAQQLGGAQTITFAPALAGQTLTLSNPWSNADGYRSSSALTIENGVNVTIQGPSAAPGITLNVADTAALRHFVVASGGSLSLTNLTLTGGKPTLASYNFGGSIWNFGALTVEGCTFTGNTTPSEGGAIQSWSDSVSLLVENSTFTGNQANAVGGAIVSGAKTMTFHYVTISGNTSPDGNSLEIYGYPLTMIDSLLAGNGNEGVSSVNGGTFSGTSTNNIFSSASAPGLTNGVNANQLAVPATQLHLATLANNGGPTATIALQPGSLAIDAGVPISGISSDERGIIRPQGNAPDIGAFELVTVQALAPILAPGDPGPYENSVEVSITSPSPNATIRYTTDGSTPSETNGQIYGGPFALTAAANVQAIAYGRGYFDSPISSNEYLVETPLVYWYNIQNFPVLGGPADFSASAGDGVANLLKFAFNMAPNAGDVNKPNVQVLTPNGTAGLPLISHDPQGHLVIEYIRRTAATFPGVTYTVETSADLANWSPLDQSGATVTPINTDFERVIVTDPTVTSRRFGRVRVADVEFYNNDFNDGIGPATLHGSALWVSNGTDGAVQLTDGGGGELGSVIFDGIVPGYHPGGFQAFFNLLITSSGTPADGVSFAIGDLPAGAWGEAGPGGSHSLAIGFDTYDNGGTGAIGIHVWVNGTHVASNPINPVNSSNTSGVEIDLDPAGNLTVQFNGTVVIDHLPISGFSVLPTDKVGIGARTGGYGETATIDNVRITPLLF